MTLYVASEVRMHVDNSGNVRAAHTAARYDAWAPYLAVFGRICVLARVDLKRRSEDGVVVDGPGVEVVPLPYYHGALEIPLGLFRVYRALRSIGRSSDAFVGRVPEFISMAVLARARHLKAPHVAILAADPEVLRHVLPGPLGRLFSAIMRRLSRDTLARADAVVYVSQNHYQEMFPVPLGTPTLGRSNVVLGDDWISGEARLAGPEDREFRLCTVGALDHGIKGVDHLLRVVETLVSEGRKISITIVGSGRLTAMLKAEAQRLGVDARFTGEIHDRSELRSILDSCDVYVSGSRSEGLPRATVEAMACALPVVTTASGASAELVDPPYLVPIDDVGAFVEAIRRLMDSPDEYSAQSAESLQRAGQISRLADPQILTDFLRANLPGSNDGD